MRVGGRPWLSAGGPVRAPRLCRRLSPLSLRLRRGGGRPHRARPHHDLGAGAHPPGPGVGRRGRRGARHRERRTPRADLGGGLRPLGVRDVRRGVRPARAGLRGQDGRLRPSHHRRALHVPGPDDARDAAAAAAPPTLRRPRRFGPARVPPVWATPTCPPSPTRPSPTPTAPSAGAWATGTGSCCGRRDPCGCSWPRTPSGRGTRWGPTRCTRPTPTGRGPPRCPGRTRGAPSPTPARCAARACTPWSPPRSAWRSPAGSTPAPRSKLKPLVAGLDPALGWASLELFVDRVVPALEAPAAQ